MNKQLFMAELVAEYHPEYSKSKDLKRQLLQKSNHFNLTGGGGVEGLLEETVRFLGKFKKCNGDGQDFPDGSDFKTASIHPTPTGTSFATFSAPITGVYKTYSCKLGALRTFYWNPHKEIGHYIYIPKSIWENVSIGSNGSVRGYYNLTRNDFTTWVDCPKFKTIKELATYRE